MPVELNGLRISSKRNNMWHCIVHSLCIVCAHVASLVWCTELYMSMWGPGRIRRSYNNGLWHSTGTKISWNVSPQSVYMVETEASALFLILDFSFYFSSFLSVFLLWLVWPRAYATYSLHSPWSSMCIHNIHISWCHDTRLPSMYRLHVFSKRCQIAHLIE